MMAMNPWNAMDVSIMSLVCLGAWDVCLGRAWVPGMCAWDVPGTAHHSVPGVPGPPSGCIGNSSNENIGQQWHGVQ